MTIEELKLANAIDTLIKEAKSTFIEEDSELANLHHLASEECYWNNQCTESRIEAYEEILKLLHKKDQK